MSVKDRLDRLEARIGETYFVFPLAPHSKMIHDLQVDMRNAEASRGDIFKRIESNADDINTLKEALPDVEDKINSLEKKFENYNPDDFIRGDLHRKCNYLHRCMEGIQLKIKEFEALGARVEELENAEADTRWNAPDNSTKPEKFIKVVDDKSEQHLIIRFKDIKVIRSSWDDEEEDGGITFVITLANRVMKSYFDKDTWQHDLNKIEWFIYDDALLLDLTGEMWNDPSTNLSAISETSEWKSCKGLPGFCPKCGGQLYWSAKTYSYLSEAVRLCTQCHYKES